MSVFPDPYKAAHDRLLHPPEPMVPQPAVPASERQGWIYFIGAEDSPIKVGWATDVEKRLDALQIGQWVELRCFGRIPGTQVDEADAQSRLRPHNVRGEWFERGPALELYAELQKNVKPKLRRVQ